MHRADTTVSEKHPLDNLALSVGLSSEMEVSLRIIVCAARTGQLLKRVDVEILRTDDQILEDGRGLKDCKVVAVGIDDSRDAAAE